MTPRPSRSAFTFGFCTSGHHRHCHGALNRPAEEQPLVCDCNCHAGQEVAPRPPATDVRVARSVEPGKRDTKLLDAWGKVLRDKGSLSVPAPEDKASLTSTRERMYTAARRQALRVAVRVTDGQVVATVK